MLKSLSKILCCPKCHSDLTWNIQKTKKEEIIDGKATCSGCDISYPVSNGIAVFLTDVLERNDLWEQIDSNLSNYINQNPDIKKKLMDSPLKSLESADQLFRSLKLMDDGDYESAYEAKDRATPGIYTKEYLNCFETQINFFKKINNDKKVNDDKKIIIDLASGMGELAKKLVGFTDSHIVFTDFSPNILIKDQKELKYLGISENTSLLAFDARLTPFKDKSVELLTSNLGLSNVEEPKQLFSELRRIVRGDVYAIHFFVPENDEFHKNYVKEQGISEFIFETNLVSSLEDSGFKVELLNLCESIAKPTPHGKIIKAGIDGIPGKETVLKWCIIHAS